MGIAILWITFYHMGISVNYSGISFLKETGFGGVDIFAFCTGLGCFYSLSKNDDVIAFYVRRIKRIYPAYWCILPLWYIFEIRTNGFKPTYLIGNILGLQSFTGNGYEVSWYISAMILFYLLCPIIYMCIVRAEGNYKKLLLMFAGLVVGTVAFWSSLHMNIMTTRIPTLFIGMLYGYLCLNGRDFSRRHKWAAVVGLILGIALLQFFARFFSERLRAWGLLWYPFILIAPCVCVLTAMLFFYIEKCKVGEIIISVLSKIGELSFELFLCHILAFNVLEKLIELHILPSNNVIWLAALIIAASFAILLKLILKHVIIRTRSIEKLSL